MEAQHREQSFCRDSSCSHFRNNEDLYSSEQLRGIIGSSHVFYAFNVMGW